MREVEIGDALARLLPSPSVDGDWEAVLRDARPARHRGKPLAVSAFAAVAAVIALALLLWPSSQSGGGILDRALAAIGDGPVLHVVLREGWGRTLVNLRTGARTRLHAERELWYDPERGLHEISRLGGVVEFDILVPAAKLTADRADWVQNFVGGYRRALETGTARVSGTDVVDGIPVYWIKVHRELLPDVADGKLHEFAQQVAVSQATYAPVATRDTRDGETGPDGITRVLSVDTRGAGEGNFRRITPDLNGIASRYGVSGDLTQAEAASVLGRQPLWPGPEVSGLQLVQVARVEASSGFSRDTGEWAHTETAVRLSYGDAPVVGRPPDGPRVSITESTKLVDEFRRGVRNYVPPSGSILLVGPYIGWMRQDGLYLSFEGTSEDLILAAARVLQPMT